MSAVQQTSQRATYRNDLALNSARKSDRSDGDNCAARSLLPRDLAPIGIAFLVLMIAVWLLLPTAAAAQSANLTGLNLTGIPTAPTAALGTNTNQIATTAFVMANGGTGASGSTTGTTPTTSVSTSTVALPGLAPRTLAARAADIYNVRDYGASGTNSFTTLSAQFPSSATASLAAFASQSVNGMTPYSWMTNPAFGLTFSIPTSADEGGAGKTLTFLEPLSGINGWSAIVAAWQDPAHGNYLIQPGMLVSGSCISANTTVATVSRVPGGAGYGTVTLSQPSLQDCPSGASITFAISSAQLQAATIDWLGIQGAMAAAWLNSAVGGSIYIPAGNYMLNRSLVNPGGVTDASGQTPNLDVHGDGVAETRLQFPTDLGSDECAVAEATRGPSSTSLSSYHDLRLIGPTNYTRVEGTSPNAMDGLCIGVSVRVYNVFVENMRAGVNGLKDHWSVRDSTFANNGYGVYFAPYTSTLGGQSILNTSLAGNTIASIAVATTNQMDTTTLTNIHTGFGPYGFYREPVLSNVTNSLGLLSGTVLTDVWIEAVGNAWIYGAGKTGNVDGNVFIGGGYSDVGAQTSYAIPNGAGGVLGSPAVIYTGSFTNNTMQNTNWSSYGSVTDAIIEVSGTCTNNTWSGDTNFVFHGLGTTNPLLCPIAMDQNRFITAIGDGLFHHVSSAVTAGEALYDSGLFTDKPFLDGSPFAGIAASPAAAGGSVGVVVRSDQISATKADATQSIYAGQPVFATSGGLEGGFNPQDAVGIASQASNAGSTTVWTALDPGMRAGGAGAKTGLGATGTTQSTAYSVQSSVNEFNTVPAGSGAQLSLVPIGSVITIFNDGANALNVYPPAGGSVGTSPTNAAISIPTGSSATLRRLSASLWHQ